MRVAKLGDAFGQALLDCYRGLATTYVIEREDGYIDPGQLTTYFTEHEDWPELEKPVPDLIHGRVLDVGCGAGRHCLHFQKIGLDAVGIDNSPLAVSVAKERGVKNAVAVSVDEMAGRNPPVLGRFDSIVMLGHNIGLLHGLREGRKILSAFREITSPGARIVGTTCDAEKTGNKDHLEYQAWNISRGRMPGQIRFRIRHRRMRGEWMDYLFLSPEELEGLVAGTGWEVERISYGAAGFGNSSYLAVLRRA